MPRQARAIGYLLRRDDLVFRRGILWQRIVAVPYGRMQLVDITHGPLDRGFGIAQLKLVTAAASTGVAIPGLEAGGGRAAARHARRCRRDPPDGTVSEHSDQAPPPRSRLGSAASAVARVAPDAEQTASGIGCIR